MNCKRIFLSAVLCLNLFWAYSQRNPDKEILVYFTEGVSQEIKIKNGLKIKKARVDQAKLKSSLVKVGITDSVIYVALPKFEKSDTLKVFESGRKIKQADMTRLFRINVPGGKNRQELVDYLNTLPQVLYADPNGRARPCVTPNDTEYPDQWGLNNTIESGNDIHAEAAWDIYTGNANNIIGIIDGGVDVLHEDLDDKISGGDYGFGWGGHGIHVSGIAAAESDNYKGVCGVDWKASIHNQRIDYLSDDIEIYQAVVDAVNYSENVHVLNNSWSMYDEYEVPGKYSNTVRLAFAYAYMANRTSVVAMGNDEDTYPGVVQYPAGFENVIAVGSTDRRDAISPTSVNGEHIDVCAPGVAILSTVNGGYGNDSGTSMAAPFVSGLASLLKGYNASLANDDIENIIKLSADTVPGMDEDEFSVEYGFGRINAEQALLFLNEPYTLAQNSVTGANTFNSTDYFMTFFFGVPGLSDGKYFAKRHEVRKEITFPQSYCNVISAWGRGVFSTGFNDSDVIYGEGFCEVMPGTLTSTGATLRTYVYELTSLNGSYLGYYPAAPANVNFAYTVLGILQPQSTISGLGSVCSSSNATFTLNDRPPGTTVSWTKSSNLTYVSGQGTNTYTVNGSPGWVQAIVSGTECGDITILKSFTDGSPSFGSANISGPTQLTPGLGAVYSIAAAQGASTYNWVIPTGCYANYCWNISSGQGSTLINVQAGSVGSGVITCSAINSCGTDSRYLNVNVQEPSGGGGGTDPCDPYMTVFPNPNKGKNIIVGVIYPPDPCDETMTYSETGGIVSILNNMGQTVYSKKHYGNNINIDGLNLSPGLYYVKYVKDNYQMEKSIIIE